MKNWLLDFLYNCMDWAVDRLISLMARISDSEPTPPRKPEVDFTHGSQVLPEEILAIVRVTYYENGKASRLDEFRLMEEPNGAGIQKLNELVVHCLNKGANVGILTEWPPEILKINS